MNLNHLFLIIEIVVFTLIVYLDAIGVLPISQTVYLIPFIWITLRFKKEKFSTIGFSFSNINLKKAIIVGVLLGVALEVFATAVTTPIISNLFDVQPDLSELQDIKGDIVMLIVYIVLSWVLAAFGEEICFRGYLMNRIATLFGNNKTAWIVSLLLSSILFGWGHTEQGISGWIQEGISGLFLGIIFLASKNNLTIPIIAHGTSNTLAFILICFDKYPGV